jgi:hypothetical protein
MFIIFKEGSKMSENKKTWRQLNPNMPCCNLIGQLCTDCKFNNKLGRELLIKAGKIII